MAAAEFVDPQLWMMGLDIPAAAFGAGWHQYRLFTTVIMLLLLIGVLFGGLVGDLVGHRRVLLLAASSSAVAGGLTALVPSLPWFVAARSLDAAAGAVALPLSLAVIHLAFRGRERQLALFAYTLATSGALLVSFLAIVLEASFGWRATLVLPTTLGIIGSVLVWRYVPTSRGSGRILWRAATAVGWSLTLLPLVFGFASAHVAGTWRNPVSLTALVVSGLGVATLVVAWRGRVRRRLFERLGDRRRHLLTMMLLSAATLGFGLTGYALQLYGYFSVVHGLGPVLSGLALAPILAVSVLASRRVARLALQSDARTLIAGGLFLMGISVLVTALISPATPYWPLIAPLAVFGLGFIVAQTAWTSVFLNALPAATAGATAGIKQATGMVGSALGGALLASVLMVAGQANFEHRLGEMGYSEAEIAGHLITLQNLLSAGVTVSGSVLALTVADAALLGVYYDAYMVGITTALALAGGTCLVVALLTWLVLDPPRAGEPSVAENALADPI